MQDINRNFDYRLLTKTLDLLCERYPFLRRFSIGQSVAGREIHAVRIGRNTDNVLLAGAFHSSEHITTNVLVKFIEELCLAFENDGAVEGINVKKGLYGRGVVIIPRVNPDGCEIAIHGKTATAPFAEKIRNLCSGDYAHYNSNLRGVDLNHNFDADWVKLKNEEKKSGIFGPAATRYGGPFPESEPETAALCEFCRNSDISHVAAFHTQGEVIYWTYGDKNLPKANRWHRYFRPPRAMPLMSPAVLHRAADLRIGL